MSSRYKYVSESLPAPVVVGASQSAVVVSEPISLTGGGACTAIRLEVVTSAVTATTGITLAVQSQLADNSWVSVAGLSAAVTAAGCAVLSMNAHSAAGIAAMPLARVARLVVTTGVGDAVTINSVRSIQPE